GDRVEGVAGRVVAGEPDLAVFGQGGGDVRVGHGVADAGGRDPGEVEGGDDHVLLVVLGVGAVLVGLDVGDEPARSAVDHHLRVREGHVELAVVAVEVGPA